MDMEKVMQVVSEKSDPVRASDEDGGIKASSSSSMADLNQELTTQVLQAVEEMTSKWNSAEVGAGIQRVEGHPVSVPGYLKIHPSDIKKVQQIGVGASAEVYEATWSHCPCAVKRFSSAYSLGLVSLVQQELEFLIALRHPHVVRLMGLSVDSQQQCSIVMELMGSSLHALIKSRMRKRKMNAASTVPFPPSEALNIITKIALGMWFLHSKGISHRDLKSANVLVQDFGDYIEVKIVDFGASLNIDSSEMRTAIGVGTGFWRAPEILPSKTADRLSNPNLMAADVYSFAMTCYEVLTGRSPFQGQLQSKEYDKVIEGLRPELPGNLDGDLRRLIESCWAPDPKHRPNFENICERLLYIRSKKSANDVVLSFLRWFPQIYGAITGLVERVLGKEQSTRFRHYDSDDNSSSWEGYYPMYNPFRSSEYSSQRSNGTLSLAMLKDHLRLLTIIEHNDLKKQRFIGGGSSCRVYAATWLGCTFAVKRFRSDARIELELAMELEFLITLCHPHVVQLVGVSLGPYQELMIVMELMNCSLRELIESRMQKSNRPFDIFEAVLIIKKIASAMAFLHSRDVIHRDLKSFNVLVREHPGQIDIKIVDFGLARYFNKSETHTGYWVGTGTGFWRAPEILPSRTADWSKELDLKELMATDVYSFAMTCYEVLTGKLPFHEYELKHSEYDEVIEGLRPTLPSDLCPDLKGLIEKCWHGEPEQRPYFTYICDEIQKIEQALSSSTS